MSTYKEEKEAFVSHTTGSSLRDVLRISSITVASLALLYALSTRTRLSHRGSSKTWYLFLLEASLLSVPILLGLTIMAGRPLWISVPLAIATFAVSFSPRRQNSNRDLSDHYMHIQHSESKIPVVPIPPFSSLTVYRANMLLLTIIAILAVDFPVFPRYLAKCESWGISMMDLGVGSFVFSQGLVAAIPYLKNGGKASAPLPMRVLSTLKKVSPVLFLGLLRVLLVKGTDYPEHVTEYGVHWNFFITLGLLPVFSTLLEPWMSKAPIWVLALGVTAVHQYILSYSLVQSWALGDDRSTLASMNKEGLVSLPGYVAIHIFGFATGMLILPPSPSFVRRAQKSSSHAHPPSKNHLLTRQLDKTAIELCAYTVLWWYAFGTARWMGGGRESVSRRLANGPYVLLIAAYNSLFLLAYIILEILFSAPTIKREKGRKRSYTESRDMGTEHDFETDLRHNVPRNDSLKAPGLFEAINLNGLPVFLLANVATGLVNMSLPTMYTSDAWAMVILVGYTFGICGIAWLLRERRILRL